MDHLTPLELMILDWKQNDLTTEIPPVTWVKQKPLIVVSVKAQR